MSPAPRVTKRRPIVAEPALVHGRVLIRVERCKGCQYCVEFCPQHVLKMSPDFNPKGFHYPVVAKDVCINCTLCLSLCPEYAIHSRPVRPRPADANPAVPSDGVGRSEASSKGSKS